MSGSNEKEKQDSQSLQMESLHVPKLQNVESQWRSEDADCNENGALNLSSVENYQYDTQPVDQPMNLESRDVGNDIRPLDGTMNMEPHEETYLQPPCIPPNSKHQDNNSLQPSERGMSFEDQEGSDLLPTSRQMTFEPHDGDSSDNSREAGPAEDQEQDCLDLSV